MEREPTFCPRISVVVISKDRHSLLEKAVASLKLSDYPADCFELVVVEEGDRPTPLAGVKYVFLPRKNLGLGFARNQGVLNAKNDILAFTDDDCLVDPLWLRKLTAVFADPGVGGAAGSTFAQEGSLIGSCEDVLGFPGGGHKRYHASGGQITKTNLLSGCNCAYRSSIVKSIRFKEDGFGRLGADDYLLGVTVAQQHTCLYVPDAVVFHKPRASFPKIIRWFSRRRINELLVEENQRGGRKYHYLLHQPHRSGLLRLLAVVLLLFLSGPYFGILLFSMGLFWYSFMFCRSFAVTRYCSRRSVAFLVPLVKFVMDAGIVLGEVTYFLGSPGKIGQSLNEYRR